MYSNGNFLLDKKNNIGEHNSSYYQSSILVQEQEYSRYMNYIKKQMYSVMKVPDRYFGSENLLEDKPEADSPIILKSKKRKFKPVIGCGNLLKPIIFKSKKRKFKSIISYSHIIKPPIILKSKKRKFKPIILGKIEEKKYIVSCDVASNGTDGGSITILNNDSSGLLTNLHSYGDNGISLYGTKIYKK